MTQCLMPLYKTNYMVRSHVLLTVLINVHSDQKQPGSSDEILQAKAKSKKNIWKKNII